MKNELTFKEALKKELKNPEFKKEWDDKKPERDAIRALSDARIALEYTQEELAEKVGMNQADISKFEHGTRVPSLKTLKKIADAVGMKVVISFEPK